jgi:tRNA (guanosine-2'-O-)-methyltransferase
VAKEVVKLKNPGRGYFGIGIENMKSVQNLGTLWRSAINLGADFIFVIGKRYKHQCSDTTKAFRHIPLFQYEFIEDFVIPDDCRLIGVEILEQSKDLITFQHPERAVYLLGAEDYGLSPRAIDRCHDIVKFDSRFCMNVSCAGSILMWDRKCKATLT